MKKFAILSAFVTLIGCSQSDEALDNIPNPPAKNHTEFYASMPECDTRTYVEDNKYLRWNAGDEITVFAGNSYNSHWQFAGEDGANSGKFNEISESGFVTGTPLDLTANYAIYPYDENITITEAGVVSLTLPAVQEYNPTYENSFGAGANTMMAVTKNTHDNFLAFKNLCGYLKLKFYGDDVTVKSISVKGNNGEKIAGPATVSMAYGSEPTITMGDDATDTIKIDCGEGVTLSNDSENPTTFWVVIPEITFEGGITIEVTDINGQTFTKQTTNAVPIENNLIQPMATLGVEFAPVIPNNEIWYTATAKVEPYDRTVFGAKYQSNEWDSETGKGVITFDGEVTSIGNYAFYRCTSLTSVTIPDSVTSIGYDAFWNCTSLTSVTIGNGVTSIEYGAFGNCTSLTSVYISDLSAWCKISFNSDFANPLQNRAKLYLNGSELTDITIPSDIAEIKNFTFYGCTSLTSVTIPDSVTSIGIYAFYRCTSLTSVTIGNGVASIGSLAFSDCTSLTSVTIGNGVASIGSLAFYGCTSLTSVTIPDSVTSIGDVAFSDCTSLTSVIIPDSVTSIGWEAFRNCESLTSVIIPDSVTSIGDYAFWMCTSLIRVTIPDSVTSIGYGAFYGCTSLTSVYCKPTTPPTGGSSMFNNNASWRKIYVPRNSVSAYKSAEYWSDYASSIAGYDF